MGGPCYFKFLVPNSLAGALIGRLVRIETTIACCTFGHREHLEDIEAPGLSQSSP